PVFDALSLHDAVPIYVYVKTVGAGDTLNRSRSPGDEHYPLWLPDGRGLLYARVDADGLAVMRVAALGGASTRVLADPQVQAVRGDRKSTRLNSSHVKI